MTLTTQIDNAVQYIRSITDFEPELGLILGSGLGSYAEQIEDPIFINYGDIPEFPVSTVAGHAGRFVLGMRFGRRVIAMQGRFHYYEGYSQSLVTLPIRVMKKLGVSDLLVTNAAGGVNTDFPVGALMLITDHINYSGTNPLIGENIEEFGPRFPDMTDIYTKELRVKAKQLAMDADISLQEGVYVMFSGPSYETPAEIRMARILGADAVGMSTAPEAIVARHAGMRVLGISCITNFAAGILDAPLIHEEVVAVTTKVNREFVRLLDLLIKDAF